MLGWKGLPTPDSPSSATQLAPAAPPKSPSWSTAILLALLLGYHPLLPLKAQPVSCPLPLYSPTLAAGDYDTLMDKCPPR